MTKIYPSYNWLDEEIIGDGKWTCPCGQPNFFETIDIYDDVVCSLCAKKYKMIQTVYLEPHTSGERAK